MDLEDIMAIKRRINDVFLCIDEPFPCGAQVQDLKEEVEAGEEALALTTFCEQLYEYDVKIPRQSKEEITALGQILEIEERYWRNLECAE